MKLTRSDLELAGALEADDFAPLTAPNVAIDSRLVQGGEIFVALKGEKRDGHEFVQSAIENGASLCVVSRAWRAAHRDEKGNFLVVQDPLVALQELARLYRRKLAIPVVAIGGNSGKTTTKEMTACVLRSTFKTLATEGNFNNHIGVPLTLFGLRSETEIAVIEMGMNRHGEMTRLCDIAEPTAAVITNIGKAHIEFFGTIENVAKAEGELFDWIASHDGVAFVNADDELVLKRSERVTRRIFYGTKKNPRVELDVFAEELGVDELGRPKFRVHAGEASEEIALKISGRHNVQNALVAVAIGLNFGVPLDRVKRALEAFEINPALKRMSVSVVNGIVLMNDSYNANPESMRAGLNALKAVKNAGKKIAVLGDMLELGALSAQEHEELGKFISTLELDALLGYGDEMKRTVETASATFKKHFDSKSDLAKTLAESIAAGDAILFKGSRAMKMETVFEETMNWLSRVDAAAKRKT
ncbi:MAG: UDP-N-acetylmuramoyl-tripeptide--D-alanyl-D-alanine ligase [Chloroherpetonaceae bacterium]|nr:UDP-N-acetylmuramoyl-tripeptide--D-alanyl-D-alanine ligase [Chloroherpetonaceae bacterium]MDW8437643.1 UDP-N-acetylmuramoyl-tripeptide--D-alanyl-D-alanine ligase [Chloroherpetonaceae bacterium]